MCLYTKESHLKFAKSDIVCYKIFVFDTFLGKIFTPYAGTEIDLYKLLSNHEPFRANEFVNKKKDECGVGYDYDKGLIHSFVHNPTQKHWASLHGDKMIVCKCHIPKYTRYVSNEWEIASKKIIIDKIVYDERFNWK